jgi:hypothetical protein
LSAKLLDLSVLTRRNFWVNIPFFMHACAVWKLKIIHLKLYYAHLVLKGGWNGK